MYDVIRQYKSYLETECRFPQETVVHHLGNLPIIFDQLEIQSLGDINPEKVFDAWKYRRWEPINKGIQISESAQKGYMSAFKEFLRYLEEKGLVRERGVSDIINIPDNAGETIRGLSEIEQRDLREHLLFNVGNDTQRRETALMMLLLNSGCSISEALALNVHPDGVIYTDQQNPRSGDFTVENGQVFVNFRGSETVDRRVALSAEVVHFLNFYLENRKYRQRMLFLSDARKSKLSRLSKRAAIKIVERVFYHAGVAVRPGKAPQVLQMTALEKGLRSEKPVRQIVSLTGQEAESAAATPEKATPWSSSPNSKKVA